MNPPYHLQIFNPTSIATRYAFQHFTDLPPELRIKIWCLSLQRQRIVKVVLRSHELIDGLLQKAGLPPRPESYNKELYGASVDAYNTINELFRTSRESRQAALSFYRVHLQCWMRPKGKHPDYMEPGVFYFNPEYDFLYIHNVRFRRETDKAQVAQFIHDLKFVHDPMRIGLLNLAMDSDCLYHDGTPSPQYIDVSLLDATVKASLQRTVLQLRQIFFLQNQPAGRHVLGFLHNAPTHEYHVTPSFPISALPRVCFGRLSPDPRPIQQDLAKIFINLDPLGMIYAWKRLIKDCFEGSVVKLECEERILLSFEAASIDVCNRKDAQALLQKEEGKWALETSKRSLPWFFLEDKEERVSAAFGHWIFPIYALGPIPEDPATQRHARPKYIDFTKFRPDLALFDLP